jgi:hypothetical protein
MAKPTPGSRWDKRRLVTLPDLSDEPPDDAELAMEIARQRAKEVLNVVNWQLSTLPHQHALQVLWAATKRQKARQPEQETAPG